jgi:hypothetical protein
MCWESVSHAENNVGRGERLSGSTYRRSRRSIIINNAIFVAALFASAYV